MFRNFCVGIHRYSVLTYDVIKSYLKGVRDKKIRHGYITLEKKGFYVIKKDLLVLVQESQEAHTFMEVFDRLNDVLLSFQHYFMASDLI